MADSLSFGFAGFGLIGGSIAKALRRVYPGCRIIACDGCAEGLALAMEHGVLNQAGNMTRDTDPQILRSAFAGCDYIFLCMPVSENIALLPKLRSALPPSCILTDVGSVKTGIHKAVKELGMEGRFIGGHPMAGSEKSGYASANDRLLENAYYILTPADGVPDERKEQLQEIISAIGAIPIVINEELHDQVTAAISHLPHIIAFSLVNLVRESDTPDSLMRRLAAGGFRDITRIASSSPEMWESICLENRKPVLDAIDSYTASLQSIKEAISSGDGKYLNEFFRQARDYRDDMPSRLPGSIGPACDLFVDIIDEAGAIATLATILASNNISIKNIAIIHNREYEEGVLRIEFYDQESVKKAAALLTRFSYTVHKR